MTSDAAHALVVDVPDRARFEIRESEQVVGFTEYRRSAGRIAFMHTEIAPEREGRGYASRLIAGALREARREGLAVLPFCPFVRRYVADHADEYLDLVPQAQRRRFGLPGDE